MIAICSTNEANWCEQNASFPLFRSLDKLSSFPSSQNKIVSSDAYRVTTLVINCVANLLQAEPATYKSEEFVAPTASQNANGCQMSDGTRRTLFSRAALKTKSKLAKYCASFVTNEFNWGPNKFIFNNYTNTKLKKTNAKLNQTYVIATVTRNSEPREPKVRRLNLAEQRAHGFDRRQTRMNRCVAKRRPQQLHSIDSGPADVVGIGARAAGATFAKHQSTRRAPSHEE